MSENIIELQDVSFAYNKAPALKDVSFAIDSDGLYYIVGPNGGGKTTLLKLIVGLIAPDSGSVRVFGEHPCNIRSRIGYTPQHIHFDPKFPITVEDIVLMGRLIDGSRIRFSKQDRIRARQALEDMDMVEFERRQFSELSGGQKQRVLIARALATNPQILLLDEPTANVDVQTEDKLTEIVHKLSGEMTILMVSHDIGFVEDHVQDVICVNRTVAIHPTSDITDETMRSIYGRAKRMIRHDLKIDHSKK